MIPCLFIPTALFLRYRYSGFFYPGRTAGFTDGFLPPLKKYRAGRCLAGGTATGYQTLRFSSSFVGNFIQTMDTLGNCRYYWRGAFFVTESVCWPVSATVGWPDGGCYFWFLLVLLAPSGFRQLVDQSNGDPACLRSAPYPCWRRR